MQINIQGLPARLGEEVRANPSGATRFKRGWPGSGRARCIAPLCAREARTREKVPPAHFFQGEANSADDS